MAGLDLIIFLRTTLRCHSHFAPLVCLALVVYTYLTMLLYNWQYFLKLCLLFLFQAFDLALNSTAEYNTFTSSHAHAHAHAYTYGDTRTPSHDSSASSIATSSDHDIRDIKLRLNKIHLFLCTCQVLTQLSSFTAMFSLFCATFPFQIGLIGVLTKRFSRMLILQGVYFILTMVVCSVRLSTLYDSDGVTMVELWEMRYYTILSFLHKIGE